MSRGVDVSAAHLASWRRAFAPLEPLDPCFLCAGAGRYTCALCSPKRPCRELFGADIAECDEGWIPCDECHGRDPRRQLAVILGIEIDLRVLDVALATASRLTIRVRPLCRELLFGRWRLPRYQVDGDDEIVERRTYPHEQLVLRLVG